MNIIDKLELGIIYKDGKVINHRSLIKVILNPFFRFFGINIATIYDEGRNVLLHPVIIPCEVIKKIEFTYKNNAKYKIEKRRRII